MKKPIVGKKNALGKVKLEIYSNLFASLCTKRQGKQNPSGPTLKKVALKFGRLHPKKYDSLQRY